jgi:hypothetical protein
MASGDVSARYLKSTSRAGGLVSDLKDLSGWRARRRLIAQYLFPSTRYMRETYAPGSRRPVVLLYWLRAWRGMSKWLARPAKST